MSAAESTQRRAPEGTARLLASVDGDRVTTLDRHLRTYGPLVHPNDLIGAVAASRLRGRGGAGFPTADKLRAVADQRGRPVVVVNAVEGEPASKKDRALLRVAPHLVLDGASLVARELGAREAIVAVSSSSLREHATLTAAIREREQRRMDGIRLGVATVRGGFVSGEETAVLRALGGGPPKPTLKPPYPFERGLDGAPTLVQNAETLAHVALIARFGPEWFGRGTALLTLGGAVARPGVHEVDLGTTLGDALLRTGGVNGKVSAFLVGGFFGKWVPADEAAALPLAASSLGAGAIVALPANACAVAEVARVVRYLSGESAGQCGPCVHGLDAIAGALEASAASDRRAQLRRWSEHVTGRGACRHPDGAARFVASALEVFADDFDAHARGAGCRGRALHVLPVENRRPQ